MAFSSLGSPLAHMSCGAMMYVRKSPRVEGGGGGGGGQKVVVKTFHPLWGRPLLPHVAPRYRFKKPAKSDVRKSFSWRMKCTTKEQAEMD